MTLKVFLVTGHIVQFFGDNMQSQYDKFTSAIRESIAAKDFFEVVGVNSATFRLEDVSSLWIGNDVC